MPHYYKSRRWTMEEDRSLRQMMGGNLSVEYIAGRLGRTQFSVRDRWRWLNKTPEQKMKRRDQVNENRKQWRSSRPEIVISRTCRPSNDLLAERDARYAAPRTIGQVILGDPPPGYSALDRKRRGEQEPSYIDKRLAQFQRVPSLMEVDL